LKEQTFVNNQLFHELEELRTIANYEMKKYTALEEQHANVTTKLHDTSLRVTTLEMELATMTAQLTQTQTKITHHLEKEKLTSSEMKLLQEHLEKEKDTITKQEEQLRKYASITSLIHSLSSGNQSPSKIITSIQKNNQNNEQNNKKTTIDLSAVEKEWIRSSEIEESLFHLSLNEVISQDVA